MSNEKGYRFREAIQLLDELLLRGNFTDQYGDMEDSSPYEEAVEIAREAIEKQIPTTPDDFDDCTANCPVWNNMSDDLISRQAAIDFIKDHSYPVRYDGNSIEQGMTVTGIEQALNEMPSIHPKQKTGRWIDDNCSECGQYVYHGDANNYCPNCGAFMKG